MLDTIPRAEIISELGRFKFYLPFLYEGNDGCEILEFIESLIISKDEDNAELAYNIMKNFKYK